MMTILSNIYYGWRKVQNAFFSSPTKFSYQSDSIERKRLLAPIAVNIFCILLLGFLGPRNSFNVLISPLSGLQPLSPMTQNKNSYEVFGFAPYWTFDNLENVDFNVLTTLAYFNVPVDGNGDLERSDPGYQTFKSAKATELFRKAHAHGTKVVLTITQMDNTLIESLMDNPEAQENAISQIVSEVKKRGIDGANIDFEYVGNPEQAYRNKFTRFTENLTNEMHRQIPHSYVTVSVYASAVKEPKIYNIKELANKSDGIFMMAYDFAVSGADNAMPTSPLGGHKEGTYWYDVSTAVNDFLTEMPSNKLILGLPWYGYDYVVYHPAIKAETRPSYSWRGSSKIQTYASAQEQIRSDAPGVNGFRTGWDSEGQVGWKAYYNNYTGTWRMIFLEDVRSLGIKYDYAKDKNLGGVGMWALGFDDGKRELWDLLEQKFGLKIAYNRIINDRKINE